MSQVWVELKYGTEGQGIALCKLDSPYLLRVLKVCALERARQNVAESETLDEVIHLDDLLALERLEKILDLLIPGEQGGGNGID